MKIVNKYTKTTKKDNNDEELKFFHERYLDCLDLIKVYKELIELQKDYIKLLKEDKDGIK